MSGTIHTPEGKPWAQFPIVFTLTPSATTVHATLPYNAVTATTDADGRFGIELEVGVGYEVTLAGALVRSGSTTRYPAGTVFGITVPDGEGEIALEAIRAAANTPPDEPTVAEFAVEHLTRADNPHGVTAAQVGAYTIGEVDALHAVAVAEATWGSITGEIADQADLAAALEDRARREDVVTLATAQAIVGAKTFRGPQPEPVFLANIAPGLPEWALAGGATIEDGVVTLPKGVGVMTAIVPLMRGAQYRVTVALKGIAFFGVRIDGEMTEHFSAMALRAIVVESDSITVTVESLSHAFEVAAVKEVRIERMLPAQPAIVANGAELRAWGTNIGLGRGGQRALTTGLDNVAIGAFIQQALTTGNGNIAAGTYAQYDLTTGSENVAIGYGAQDMPRQDDANGTITGNGQTSIGAYTGQSSSAPVDAITTVGHSATAGATKATALGAGSRADHAGSVALGSDTSTTAPDQVMVGPRDIEVTDPTRGIVLLAPNGMRHRVTVGSGGTLTTAPLTQGG